MRYLLVLMLFATTSLAAPVPKQPTELTAEMLYDTQWEYDWDSMKGGWIIFYKDGTYRARHYPANPEYWYGIWTVKNGRFTFSEARVDCVSITNSPSFYKHEYRTVFKNTHHWYLDRSGSKIEYKNPKRIHIDD